MILALFQIAAIAFVALYLRRWRATVRRRNAQSWDSLVARLQPDICVRNWEGGLDATPEDQWRRMEGARGLWAMHQNARVMMEMADYAARNSDSVDRELLETLRSDAVQIRVCVVIALTRYAFSQVNEGICVHALRAASMYTGMAARMTQLLEQNVSVMVPDLAAAM